ncbi:MAG: outer rane or secreted lipoprotein [Paucimonas sp.]|jgi:hypothetical protein|nr:outer rane or secreted lipoprotein [Paucimonas sp.]
MKLSQVRVVLTASCIASFFGSIAAAQEKAHPEPPGQEKSAKLQALEGGAKILQPNAPPAALDIHLYGTHVSKHESSHQMGAHHYCRQKNRDFAQCALYDGTGKDANLIGVEYIISEPLFSTLPREERQYWHPHNYEILSGELIAPGIPQLAEHALMKEKMNSYGKTWHLWNTGSPGKPGDALPLGEPVLEWSFNRDGEMDGALMQERNKLGANMAERRQQRQDLVKFARPQEGVDALKGNFTQPTRSIPGVADRAVPRQHEQKLEQKR